MASQLISSSGCCTSCDTSAVETTLIPGPQGETGPAGANGTNGVSSYTVTTVAFTQPAEGANVTISVADTTFIPQVDNSVVLYVFVGSSGYFTVVSYTATTLTITSKAGAGNATAGTNIPPGVKVALAGPSGADGTDATGAPSDATYITQTPNGDLSAEQAMSALSSGYVKNTTGTGVLSVAASIPVSDLSGQVAVANGGTALSATPTNGQLPIGNGSGYTLATVTGGAGITVTNGSGSITISAASSILDFEIFTVRLSEDRSTPGSSFEPFDGIAASIDTQTGWNSADGHYTTQLPGVFRISAVIKSGATQGLLAVNLRKDGQVVMTVGADSAGVPIEYIDTSNTGNKDSYDITLTDTGGGSPTITCFEGSSFSVHRIAANVP